MSLIIAKPTKPTNAQDADIREPKVGDVLKYYHPRTGKYVGKVKVVNIHRHSDAKWDAQYECEYLDGELKGGRFRDEGGVNISFDAAATDAIDPKELGRRELAIASKIDNDLFELHSVLQVGANYAYELKSKNPNEYKLQSELLGRDLLSYYMNALNNHKQGAALIRNAIGRR